MLGDFFTGSTMLAGDDEFVSSGSVATSSAGATVSAGLGVIRPVSGSASGISTVTADLVRTRYLSGASNGSSTVFGVVASSPFNVLIRGWATVDGALGEIKALRGTCDGVATCGSSIMRSRSLQGQILGVAHADCTWTAPKFITGESTGVGVGAATTLVTQQAIPQIPATARRSGGVRAGGVKISRFE